MIIQWAGFTEDMIARTKEGRGLVRHAVSSLSTVFFTMWIFLLLSIWCFTYMALHDIFFSLSSTVLFGFVQWNIINLLNSSVLVAPHTYSQYLYYLDRYEQEKEVFDALPEDEQKGAITPVEPKEPYPKLFFATLFGLLLCLAGGCTWGIWLTTDYMVPSADDRTIMTLQGVLQRGQLAYHNGGLFLGAVLGLFIGALPPFVRTQNRDSFQLFYTSIARSQMTFLKSNWDQHHADLTRRSPELSSDLPFEDPPFNQRQKIMGWFSPTLVTTVKVPRKQDNIYMDEYRPPKEPETTG